MRNRFSGFTLIEVLIVVTLLGVFTVVATDTFTNIMRAQNKARVVNELEQSGNYALSVMEQQIRDAEEVFCCGSNPRCESPYAMNDIGVGIRLDGQDIRFYVWNVGSDVQSIRRCVDGSCSSSDYDLTDTDPETGVDLFVSGPVNTEFVCDADRSRVHIKLVLRPGPRAPTRRDFRVEDAVILETTVVVRGSYE